MRSASLAISLLLIPLAALASGPLPCSGEFEGGATGSGTLAQPHYQEVANPEVRLPPSLTFRTVQLGFSLKKHVGCRFEIGEDRSTVEAVWGRPDRTAAGRRFWFTDELVIVLHNQSLEVRLRRMPPAVGDIPTAGEAPPAGDPPNANTKPAPEGPSELVDLDRRGSGRAARGTGPAMRALTYGGIGGAAIGGGATALGLAVVSANAGDCFYNLGCYGGMLLVGAGVPAAVGGFFVMEASLVLGAAATNRRFFVARIEFLVLHYLSYASALGVYAAYEPNRRDDRLAMLSVGLGGLGILLGVAQTEAVAGIWRRRGDQGLAMSPTLNRQGTLGLSFGGRL